MLLEIRGFRVESQDRVLIDDELPAEEVLGKEQQFVQFEFIAILPTVGPVPGVQPHLRRRRIAGEDMQSAFKRIKTVSCASRFCNEAASSPSSAVSGKGADDAEIDLLEIFSNLESDINTC